MNARRAWLAALAGTIVGVSDADVLCSAVAGLEVTVCPSSTPCNPSEIALGEEVTFEICVKNDSYENDPEGLKPQVEAEFVANTAVAVRCGTPYWEDGRLWEGPPHPWLTATGLAALSGGHELPGHHVLRAAIRRAL